MLCRVARAVAAGAVGARRVTTVSGADEFKKALQQNDRAVAYFTASCVWPCCPRANSAADRPLPAARAPGGAARAA
jgi:hypothetical protein